jgi:large subunit ribosomal protein L4
MPTVSVLDLNGRPTAQLDLSPAVFARAARVPLIHQAVVRELADGRTGTHSTRGRSEVSGGGKKPWRQKGTGRARQGSIRATQWKGGGKPFGPRPRSYDKRMPLQMRRGALSDALSAKLAAGALVVVDRLDLGEPRTKLLLSALRTLGAGPDPTLLVVAERRDGIERAARNVPWLTVETPGHASVYQVLRAHRLVFERAALETLGQTLAAAAPSGGEGGTR